MSTEKAALLDGIELFVLDMDGTFYLGDRLLDGSLDFLRRVEETRRRFIFFTNNSSRDGEAYIAKLEGMGCRIDRRRIMTSGDVTIAYLNSELPGRSVYLVGTPALEDSFRRGGITLTEDKPDVVVVGFDTGLTYRRLERACTYIREGALFLATHMDINCPTEEGFIPDCGSFCAAITLSTGVQPKHLGKPYPETAQMVQRATGVPLERIAFVGDRLYTDVAAGVLSGARGLLVLSGETKAEDIAGSEIKPDGVFRDLAEIAGLLV